MQDVYFLEDESHHRRQTQKPESQTPEKFNNSYFSNSYRSETANLKVSKQDVKRILFNRLIDVVSTGLLAHGHLI